MRVSPLIVAGCISVGIATIATILLSLMPAEAHLPMVGPLPLGKHTAGLTTVAWASVGPLFAVLRRGMVDAPVPQEPSDDDGFWMFSVVSGLLLICAYLVVNVSASLFLDSAAQTLTNAGITLPGNALLLISLTQTAVMTLVVYAIVLVTTGWRMHQRGIMRPFSSTAVILAMFVIVRVLDTLWQGIPLDFAVQRGINTTMFVLGMLVVTLLAYWARTGVVWLGRILFRGMAHA